MVVGKFSQFPTIKKLSLEETIAAESLIDKVLIKSEVNSQYLNSSSWASSMITSIDYFIYNPSIKYLAINYQAACRGIVSFRCWRNAHFGIFINSGLVQAVE